MSAKKKLKELLPPELQESARKCVHSFRWRTSRWRSLPDFIIVGAQKSGTSSLYAYLAQHPGLAASFGKEVHYFDGGLDPAVDNYAKGERWYRASFPLRWPLVTSALAFEASPLYLFNPLVPQRLHGLLPAVKLVAVLRNPVERAISHYFHEQRAGRERQSIVEALALEEQRLAPVIADGDYKSETYMHASYKSRGRYCEQLNRFLQFFPKEQLLVLESEQLFLDPKSTLDEVCRFVGANTAFDAVDLSPRNVGTNRNKVEEDVYEELSVYFAPHNESLFDLIGQRFNW